MQLNKSSLLTDEEETAKIQIFFSARNLADLDLISVTDSFLIVYQQFTNKPKKQMLKTRIYWNDLNPDFSQTLIINFNFEIRQEIIVQIYHENEPATLIGTVSSTVGEIFSTRNKGLQKKIIDNKKNQRGTFIFKCQQIEKENSIYQFQIVGKNISVGSFFLCFGSTRCLYRIYKKIQNVTYLLYESQWSGRKNPVFNSMKINYKKLCNNNLQQPIYIKFYKESQISAPIAIGQCTTTMQQLKNNELTYLLQLEGSERGQCSFKNFRQDKTYCFTNYLSSGMQMALVICIDFTQSNGNCSDKNSLHYVKGDHKSKYEEALFESTRILMDYDADKLVPTFGFGASVNMPNFQTKGIHNCFPINGNEDDPNLFQVQGVIQQYRNCLQYLCFSGPTHFAPLLQQAMKQCRQMKKQTKQYMILMIMTDGAIHDIDKVMNLLVACGRLPLSIVIIGIGDTGKWDLMHKLDDDDCQMTDKEGNRTQRDLVQFVEFSKYGNDGVDLARQVLFQLPRQVEEYHQLVGLTPNDYQVHQVEDIAIKLN